MFFAREKNGRVKKSKKEAAKSTYDNFRKSLIKCTWKKLSLKFCGSSYPPKRNLCLWKKRYAIERGKVPVKKKSYIQKAFLPLHGRGGVLWHMKYILIFIFFGFVQIHQQMWINIHLNEDLKAQFISRYLLNTTGNILYSPASFNYACKCALM